MLFPRSYPFTMQIMALLLRLQKNIQIIIMLVLVGTDDIHAEQTELHEKHFVGPSNVKLCLSSPQYMTKVERNTWASLSLHLDHDVNGFPHTSKHVLNGHLYSDFLSSGQSKRLTTLPYSRPYMHTPTAVSATARWEQLG